MKEGGSFLECQSVCLSDTQKIWRACFVVEQKRSSKALGKLTFEMKSILYRFWFRVFACTTTLTHKTKHP